jgi:lysophospholipase
MTFLKWILDFYWLVPKVSVLLHPVLTRMAYTATENQLDLVFANNLAGATYGNGTIDAKWPACVACGVILSSLARVKMSVPDICHACFRRHCWNGSRAETPAMPIYNPKLILDPQGLDYAEWNATVWN